MMLPEISEFYIFLFISQPEEKCNKIESIFRPRLPKVAGN
jgi:hypothetical protein